MSCGRAEKRRITTNASPPLADYHQGFAVTMNTKINLGFVGIVPGAKRPSWLSVTDYHEGFAATKNTKN